MKKSRKMKTDVSLLIDDVSSCTLNYILNRKRVQIISDDETLLMDVSNSSVIKSRSRVKSGRKCRPEVDFSAGITSPLYAMETDNMESVLPTKASFPSEEYLFCHDGHLEELKILKKLGLVERFDPQLRRFEFDFEKFFSNRSCQSGRLFVVFPRPPFSHLLKLLIKVAYKIFPFPFIITRLVGWLDQWWYLHRFEAHQQNFYQNIKIIIIMSDRELEPPDCDRIFLFHRSRLYELFGQIEKEFEALYVENLSLHTKVEALTDRLAEGGMPLEKAAEIFAITNEAVAGGNKASSKKSTIQMGQKLKTAFKVPPGRNLVSSFKVGSDPNRVRYVRTFKGHRDGVWHVDAAKSNLLCSTSADQTARIWCIETGVCFAQYVGHEGSVNCARFNLTNNGNGDSILVVTASGDQSAHIWKAPTTFNQQQQQQQQQEEQQQQQQTIGACHHHSSEDEKCSDKEEIIGDESETLLTIRQPLLKLTGHSCPVIAADWTANDNQIVTASWDRTANVFDAERGEIVNILSGHDLELNYCCAHPSQKLVVTASRDTTFRLWDFRESIHSVSVFQGHTESVTSAVFTGADKIVSGSDDRSVKVWDFRNMRTALTTIRMDSPVNRIAVSRTSNIIAIPTDNRQVRLYDLNGVRITRLPSTSRRGHHRMVCCCAWADDNSHCNLFSCGFDKLVLGWNVITSTMKDKE
ncbi:WD repeat-containing protein 37 [Trichinella patagoniensis]|uniref:WD repeat-containing protein 37 n=1 Tax=Trichinella patagoniensis TaxID=990121 RepID=A0A0V0ZK03_9BILA|nr:WD repeat-containing protein 37 [Trichinella patagoniensis]